MKKVIDVNIGRVNFTIEDDAYIRLERYLKNFQSTLPVEDAKEIMEDVEIRIAEIFQKEMKYPNQVIDVAAVDEVIGLLGEVEMSSNANNERMEEPKMKFDKKLYRNPDDKKIAGVCSGLGEYLNIDTALIRVIFVVLLIGFGTALIAYIVLWIAMPEARTVAQKLEMHGEPATAENIKNYSSNYKKY